MEGRWDDVAADTERERGGTQKPKLLLTLFLAFLRLLVVAWMPPLVYENATGCCQNWSFESIKNRWGSLHFSLFYQSREESFLFFLFPQNDRPEKGNKVSQKDDKQKGHARIRKHGIEKRNSRRRDSSNPKQTETELTKLEPRESESNLFFFAFDQSWLEALPSRFRL